MKIDLELIKHLETLSRIELKDDERQQLKAQLGRIVEFVEKLQSVDTGDVGATRPTERLAARPAAEHQRDDTPEPGLERDDVLDQAPDPADGFYRVPPVIDRGAVS